MNSTQPRSKDITLIDLHPVAADMERLVVEGLSRVPKQLPAWFLYDAEGSRLFEAICRQPEYRLTAIETDLLRQEAAAMAAAMGPGIPIEFGAGSARKVSPLLEALPATAYVALDISSSHLAAACRALQKRHAHLDVLGICCDYSQLQALPNHPLLAGRRRLGFYPGSSLGNFDPVQARGVLSQFARLLGPDSCLLIGIDQPRQVASLEAAYNDRAGYSAAFATNLLLRLNRDLNAGFEPGAFTYRARWQALESRIEMALVCQGPQQVAVAGRNWRFAAGESLITEYSYKYSPEAFTALAAEAGWRAVRRWSDPNDHFSLHLLEPQR
ncbi:L-histidine N(alpha)-methyltransferase [Synechococcus sp. CS-1325]|uniref:L-histidine N(alpha)-methyltransferase n=1 Tax=unclassified Synechococcus TaxID=2626047 RepID=UPI000DB46980|nr:MULTISPECIES: L-histidine N(alpha)-methyltransferase [unclassified Synechococcus]PZV02282.1 MAG: L-histidine N(alpha)-methyltransferase [Cyanobium sp.]MCT0198928.1 L-histidine N(alpha)-methyltransferase [Synechococcus sp. CS-1325]MCT0214577.1 L-histidine N(alpha)-methyltransferase [Synechococcus sp. CS-1326]MCT0231048.1 L-histidine N(alpha)-methyltransferase [Synechococcus sp. CS-1324]MCT0233911.1 L-histidine N(alpha)-methyltransferase [Synechococcus sp. CS-1327]